MFFKSATFFQLKQDVDFEALGEALPNLPLESVEGSKEFSFGSVPLIRNSELWSLVVGECMLMRFAKSEKVIPPYAIKEALRSKVSEIELAEGRKVGRKEKSEIKDELIFTMRPNAFTKTTDVWLHIDSNVNVMAVYSTAPVMIELAFKHLQALVGSFPIAPISVGLPPATIMSDWLMENSLPGELEAGHRCDIQDSSEDKAKIKFTNLEPLSYDVTRHLDQGMAVRSLDLLLDDKISFLLRDDLTVSSVGFSDELKESAFNDSVGGALADLEASFAISSLVTRDLLKGFRKWFEIELDFKF